MTTGLSNGFVFPSEYCGQYGIYEAVKHLFSKDKQFQNLVKEESLLLNKAYLAADMEKAIVKTRTAFREKHKIPLDGTVIFFSPGNEAPEVEFSMDSVRRGIREFLLKYSSPTSLSPKAPPLETYTTVISVQKGSDAEMFVRNCIEEFEWLGKVVVVTDENNEHIDAMAASDLGICYDGQMIGQAAACHLPTMILIKMRMHHQWFSDLYN